MPLTQVRKTTNGSASAVASLTAVYTGTPAAGNLLVCGVNSDNIGTMTSTGWTLAQSSINSSGNYQYWKIAGGAESTSVIWAPAASASTEMWIAEYSGNTATPLDKTASAAGSGSTCASGTTAATTQADELAIAGIGQSGSPVGTPSAWTNSFATDSWVQGLGGTTTGIAVGTKALAATGTQTTTATANMGGNTPSGLIGTYMAAAAGGASVPNLVMPPRIPSY